MKHLIILTFCFFVFINNYNVLSQDEEESPPVVTEIWVVNTSTSKDLNVKVFPVSMVFNEQGRYDLHSSIPDENLPIVYHYMTSGNLSYNPNFPNNPPVLNTEYTVLKNTNGVNSVGFQHEGHAQPDGASGILGYGIYKFEFNWGTGSDTCWVEFDYTTFGDITFLFYDNGTSRIMYESGGSPCGERNISACGRYVKTWEQNWCGTTRSKVFGNFIYNNSIEYDFLPQDFRQDCEDESFGSLYYENMNRTGLLTNHLTIDKDIESRTLANSEAPGLLGTPTQIVISPECTLKINPSKKFEIKEDEYYFYDQTYYTKLFLKPFSVIKLEPNSNSNLTKLVIEKNNWLILECDSKILLSSGSRLELQTGSKLCMRGGTVSGPGQFIISGFVPRLQCFVPCVEDNIFEDSVNLFIDTNSILELDDSTVFVFKGNQTTLTCKENSTIKFGKGSKLIFQDGARINANGCKFVSYDSTEVWDGIYLDGIAYDTLKNCTFQSAVNGINITDNYDPFGSPGAVEISNCTFKNSTSSDLLNYVYVNNSYNVLIKGCNSEKTGTGGFTSGIIAEYCPTNGVVIADNNINYVTTGISLLQSSEYIGRNTITGSTNSGTGIYLDNSNGTIEYNTVNNFQKSVYGSYSSPYMLKNTLSNAYVKNIDLASNSYPVMKPVVSGSTLRWLGGNNTISGTPSNSGIAFADCYPLMDSGYNRITVNGSDYMNGNFTFSYTTVNAKINYWYDNPPQSSLFDISGGNVNYSDPFDGSTLPSTDGTELNSIGWGLYDTVFTKSFGDNSTPEDLFMQAYTQEMSQNYSDAITHYKEVVSSYKTSSYAPVSLSRIFNCLEKSHASSSDYQSMQNYYNSIKSNSAYPNESRELSEDFVTKSKVKQGNIQEAANDYNAIYQSNQNNSKGLHALLNKYCLENMVQGDNSSGSTNYQNHKIDILSLITGENIRSSSFVNNNTPKQFRLLQNYPNPFNPVTTIKFEIPKDVNVSIKIYDILGREVFNFNEFKLAGSYEVQFDGSNFASGMYFYKLETGGFTDTKKMVLLK